MKKEKKVKPLFVITYSKANKKFTARSVKVEKDYGYIHYIMRKNRKKNSRKQESI